MTPLPRLSRVPRFHRLALAAVLAAFCAGCASPYWQNRCADAADVFTATVGLGYGATARVGPFHTGLGANFDFYGMEAGEVGELSEFYSIIKGGGWIAEDDCTFFHGCSEINLGPRSVARGKAIAYHPSDVPFWNPPPPDSPNPARWTQIEVAAGLLGGIRLGFNPGELLDLLLGFFGADLYGDDIARGERENPHAESTKNTEHRSGEAGPLPEGAAERSVAGGVPHAESAEFAESDSHAESAENAEPPLVGHPPIP